MSRTQQVGSLLSELLGEEAMTPDLIDGLSKLDLDSDGYTQEDLDTASAEAVEAAIALNDAAWNTRYRETFFGPPRDDASAGDTNTDLPDNVNDVPDPDPDSDLVTLDDIFAEEA